MKIKKVNGVKYGIDEDRRIWRWDDGEWNDTDKVECERCGEHQAMHYGNEDLCCWCHIHGGGIPADWHVVCMAEYEVNDTLM